MRKLSSIRKSKSRQKQKFARQAKTNCIGVVKCIKDKDKYILVQNENIKD